MNGRSVNGRQSATTLRRWLALSASMLLTAVFLVAVAPAQKAAAAGSALGYQTFTGSSVDDPYFVPLKVPPCPTPSQDR